MAGVSGTLPTRMAGIATSIATAVVITALSILPFLSPAWVAFEQERAEAAAWTGYAGADLRAATDAILADLVVGPPDFDVAVAGEPVLNERERAHMRDVRSVFGGFGLIAVASALLLVAAIAGARRLGHPERAWRAVRNGARGLIAVVVLAGVVAALAFDVAFEVFHRLFFAGGSYTFDPGTERLVQLFPFRFWSETTMAVGAVIVVLALVVNVVAGRRAALAAHAATAGSGTEPPDEAAAQVTSGHAAATTEPGAAR